MKNLILLMVILTTTFISASAVTLPDDDTVKSGSQHYLDEYTCINVDSILEKAEKSGMLTRLTPRYSDKFYELSNIKNHWFAGVQGGLTAFLGDPVGCGDLFDRITPTYGLYIGKWHNPFVGTRMMFQNGMFKDANMNKHSFQAYHADLMYNITNHLLGEDASFRYWDVIPYLGCGFINGAELYHADCPCDGDNGNNRSFMIAYGVQGRYRLTDKFLLTAELGGIRTMSDFDNIGSRHGFKDNLFSLSIGVTYNIGKSNWSRAIDAKPYIEQNDYLINNYSDMRDANRALYNMHLADRNTINELRKILEIEGLLDKYGYLFNEKARDKRNYYSGLLSLRSRMDAEKNKDIPRSFRSKIEKDTLVKMISVPIHFFFKRGKVKLTDNSQLVNLDEIARVINEYDLELRIDGAADSATGTTSINRSLSQRRASFLMKELQKRNIDKSKIKAYSQGGINKYDRPEENRYGKIALYLEIK